ncbi:MAG: hypothetical protein QNL04_07740 [SAR324 cluster bacterium]|nr:hypothetical protein [SAR324 cluster bacterium]
MTVPVNSLKEDQKLWYANLVLSAILADGEINLSEIDFLKQILQIIAAPQDKASLMLSIEKKTMPPLTPPPNIPNQLLAAMFMELILIIISDIDYDDGEKAFLEKVADIFKFTKSYQKELFDWLGEGLEWKEAQLYLTQGGEGFTQVPLKKLNSEQKKWYSKVLVSTILLDGEVDSMEMSFLKMAISFLEHKAEQMEMMAYVKNRMCPNVPNPPAGMTTEILTLIFIEVILLISADEAISYTELNHLQTISTSCGFANAHFNKLVEWCNRGVTWKNAKIKLLNNVGRLQNADEKPKAAGPSSGNGSLAQRKITCVVCQKEAQVSYFQLKPKSQKPTRNIFGIPTFREANTGFDYIDYNHVSIMTCPQCLYTSNDKGNFLKMATDKIPPILSKGAFPKAWMAGLSERQAKFGERLAEIDTCVRHPATVLNQYKTAIEAELMLFKMTEDPNHLWKIVAAKVTMAEILMSAKQHVKADELLKQAQTLAEQCFNSRGDKTLVYKAARMLFLIGLYFTDKPLFSTYFQFFLNCMDKKDELDPEEVKILQKIIGEVKAGFENRPDYVKAALDGFHIKTAEQLKSDADAKKAAAEKATAETPATA